MSRWTPDMGALDSDLLPPAQRRRCSLLTRAVAQVVGDLVEEGTELTDCAIVCCTAFGEIATSVELLQMIEQGDTALSPIRFAGSVHNTAIGQLAIATAHRGVSTTVSAGRETVAMGLLETQGLFAAGCSEVVLVCADEPMALPIQPAWDAVATAFHLTTSLDGARAICGGLGYIDEAPDLPWVPAPLVGNPCSPAWGIALAIDDGAPRRVALTKPVGIQRRAVCLDLEDMKS